MEPKSCRPSFIDITGRRFGRLTVIERAPSRARGQGRWSCLCQCGNTTIVDSYYLRHMIVRSCGCLRHEQIRDLSAIHGHTGTPEYNAWRGILRRCNDQKARSYDTHGGRGIKCLWTDYDQFVADVGERPSPQHRLFRLDRDGHFESGNCAWILPKDYFKEFGYVAPSRSRAPRNQHPVSEAVPGCHAAVD